MTYTLKLRANKAGAISGRRRGYRCSDYKELQSGDYLGQVQIPDKAKIFKTKMRYNGGTSSIASRDPVRDNAEQNLIRGN